MQSIERVEKSFLGGVFSLKELNVVNQKDVDFSISSLEFRSPVVGDGVNKVVSELLRRDIANTNAFVEALGIMSNGVEKVRFSQSRPSINEKRVVGLGGSLGDRYCCSVREAVGRPDHEIIEAVFVIEARLVLTGKHGF